MHTVPVSDGKDQARGAVDFWAGLLDAVAAEGGVGQADFRKECEALVEAGKYAPLVLKLVRGAQCAVREPALTRTLADGRIRRAVAVLVQQGD